MRGSRVKTPGMAAYAHDLQKLERLAGLLLMAAAGAALLLANSPLAHDYHAILETKFGPAMPRFGTMSVHYWIADGLMAVFFLLVGLEVKREWYDGRLSTPAERRLPIIAAVAGMAVPGHFPCRPFCAILRPFARLARRDGEPSGNANLESRSPGHPSATPGSPMNQALSPAHLYSASITRPWNRTPRRDKAIVLPICSVFCEVSVP